MLVPFEAEPVPEVELGEAAENIQNMKLRKLVAFTVRQAAPDGATAFDAITAAFMANGYRRGENSPISFGVWADRNWPGRPLHIDGHHLPGNQSKARVISSHYTLEGRARAYFIETTEAKAPAFGTADIPKRFREQLANGKIDDEYFYPTLYIAELNPSDMVSFRYAGVRGQVHGFINLECPRISNAINFIETTV